MRVSEPHEFFFRTVDKDGAPAPLEDAAFCAYDGSQSPASIEMHLNGTSPRANEHHVVLASGVNVRGQIIGSVRDGKIILGNREGL